MGREKGGAFGCAMRFSSAKAQNHSTITSKILLALRRMIFRGRKDAGGGFVRRGGAPFAQNRSAIPGKTEILGRFWARCARSLGFRRYIRQRKPERLLADQSPGVTRRPAGAVAIIRMGIPEQGIHHLATLQFALA